MTRGGDGRVGAAAGGGGGADGGRDRDRGLRLPGEAQGVAGGDGPRLPRRPVGPPVTANASGPPRGSKPGIGRGAAKANSVSPAQGVPVPASASWKRASMSR